jgi:hypothetical protein
MKQKNHLFDQPKNVTRLIRLLSAICVILVALDFIVHRHISHPLENIPGFYPLYGFIGCVLLVVIAKWLRSLLMRPQDYYCKEKSTEQSKKEQHNNGRDHHVDL